MADLRHRATLGGEVAAGSALFFLRLREVGKGSCNMSECEWPAMFEIGNTPSKVPY